MSSKSALNSVLLALILKRAKSEDEKVARKASDFVRGVEDLCHSNDRHIGHGGVANDGRRFSGARNKSKRRVWRRELQWMERGRNKKVVLGILWERVKSITIDKNGGCEISPSFRFYIVFITAGRLRRGRGRELIGRKRLRGAGGRNRGSLGRWMLLFLI